MKRITVLLAEDHRIVRDGLRALLDLQPDIEVLGGAEDGREAVALAAKLLPEVIVMDIAMPQLNGMEATRKIMQAQPGTKIIILSAHSDDAYVDRVMEFGAAGYIIKQSAADLLPKAIREVAAGRSFFSPTIAKRRKDKAERARVLGKPSGHVEKLSPRELEVLQLIAEGNANKTIADELSISIKTVEKHRQSVMEKLDIHDTASLTRYAIAAGIIESSAQETTE